MSRKRQLKKERSRAEALEERLERLHRQGADEAFLEVAQGRFRDLPPRSAELYGQVADRALRRALAGADLPRAERLLSRIDRDARSRPLARLAEAVVHLAAGRLAEARSGLAACTPAAGAPWPPRLTEALAALSDPGSLTPGFHGIETPGIQAVWRFQRELAACQEQGFLLPPAKIEKLRKAAGELRAALPADPALKRLLDATEGHLRLLVELAELEKTLRRRKGKDLIPFFLERLRGGLSPSLVVAFRDSPPDALLRPLHYALRLRWRTLLALVAEQGGAATWASLHAALPALFTLDLEPVGGTERLKAWAAVEELRETRSWQQLARLLGSFSNAEKTPERMARLWSLELWAWERASAPAEEEDLFALLAEPPHRAASTAALGRLGRMAGEIADRLPAEQRPAAARFLRARLFDLCEAVHFCGHSIDAAAALLRHLPDDPGLLAVALAGAVCSQDVRARGLFAGRIASRGVAHPADRPVLLRLVEQIALEDPEPIVRILPPLRPLLGEEAWPEACEIVLGMFVDCICSSFHWGYDEVQVRRVLRDLETLRTVLAGRPGLAALEAAFDCVRPAGGGTQALRKLLESTPDLAAALTAFRVLAVLDIPGAPPAVVLACRHAREAAISRLDLRWRLWKPLLPSLASGASREQMGRLRDRLQHLLSAPESAQADREALQQALAQVSVLERMMHGSGRPRRKGKRGARRRKPRRGPAGDQPGFQLDFDLF